MGTYTVPDTELCPRPLCSGVINQFTEVLSVCVRPGNSGWRIPEDEMGGKKHILF